MNDPNPDSAHAPTGQSTARWNARSNGTRQLYRDLSLEQLRALILDGELNEADWVQREGDETWLEVGTVPELADAIPAFTFRHDRALVGETEDMDMTPMIDIVFQLLLFFLIISTFQVQKAIGFPDPGETKEAKNIPTLGELGRDRILVSIDAQNRFELLHYDSEGNLTNRETLQREELVDRFKNMARDQRKTSLVIQADDKARHENVVAVIDAGSLANLQDIRIAQPVAPQAPNEPSDEAATPIVPTIRPQVEDR